MRLSIFLLIISSRQLLLPYPLQNLDPCFRLSLILATFAM